MREQELHQLNDSRMAGLIHFLHRCRTFSLWSIEEVKLRNWFVSLSTHPQSAVCLSLSWGCDESFMEDVGVCLCFRCLSDWMHIHLIEVILGDGCLKELLPKLQISLFSSVLSVHLTCPLTWKYVWTQYSSYGGLGKHWEHRPTAVYHWLLLVFLPVDGRHPGRSTQVTVACKVISCLPKLMLPIRYSCIFCSCPPSPPASATWNPGLILSLSTLPERLISIWAPSLF